MAIYIIIKSEKKYIYTLVCALLSPLFLFPNFSKEWKGPFIPPTQVQVGGQLH